MSNEIPEIHVEIIKKTIVDSLPMSLPRNLTDSLVLQLSTGILDDLRQAKRYDYVVNSKTYTVYDGEKNKIVIGRDYNYYFSKITGEFRRWGKTIGDDPEFSPIGGEILDIEVTTICRGDQWKVV